MKDQATFVSHRQAVSIYIWTILNGLITGGLLADKFDGWKLWLSTGILILLGVLILIVYPSLDKTKKKKGNKK